MAAALGAMLTFTGQGLITAAPVIVEPADPLPPGRRFRLPPPRRYFRRRLPKLLIPPPGEDIPLPAEPPVPSEGESQVAPFPHGFVLTVGIGGARSQMPATLTTFRDVGKALEACWVPPAGSRWTSVTVRVAFSRDGKVFGQPRFPFVDAPTSEARSVLLQSLSSALKECTPLHLSPSLGAAVAGEIFAIRFINQGADHDRH